jgi:hypothetical protein
MTEDGASSGITLKAHTLHDLFARTSLARSGFKAGGCGPDFLAIAIKTGALRAEDASVNSCNASAVATIPNVQRDLVSARTHRSFRATAMNTWRTAVAAA